jgi:hypothetical protein
MKPLKASPEVREQMLAMLKTRTVWSWTEIGNNWDGLMVEGGLAVSDLLTEGRAIEVLHHSRVHIAATSVFTDRMGRTTDWKDTNDDTGPAPEGARVTGYLPDDVTPSKEFTITVAPKTWEDKIGAIPWIATLPSSEHSCTALTARRKICQRRAKFLYLALDGSQRNLCTEHTQHKIHSWDEQPRLTEWQKRVGFASDRYDGKEIRA